MTGRSADSSILQGLEFRAATPSDAERLGRAVVDGFEGYRSFAPEGWAPPSLPAEVERLRGLLGDPDVWSRLAEARGRLAGHLTFVPAARAREPVDDPALAHLRNLFVHEDFWGTGLARALHADGVDAARRRGFTAMRLFTPARQARARRFYEREGWEPVGDGRHDAGLGLALVEYRHTLLVR